MDDVTDIRHAFILAAPRTGRTLLARYLDQHPDVAVLHDTYALLPKSPDSILHPCGEKAAVHGFTPDDVARWRSLYDETPEGHDRLENALRALHEDYAAARGAKVVVHGCQIWWQVIDQIAEHFPGATCIYLTRDPRAVWSSGERRNDVEADGRVHMQMLLDCDERVRAALEGKVDLRVVHTRYENVVVEHQRAIPALWEHLGVDPARGWLKYDRKRDPHPKRWANVPNAIKWGDRSRLAAWQREMPQSVQPIVTQDCIEYITRYHYPPSFRNDRTFAVKRFLEGVPLKKIDNGEELIRGELATLVEVFNRFHHDVSKAAAAWNEQVSALEAARSPHEWERMYTRGQSFALIRANDTMAHIVNHYQRTIVR